VLIRDATVADVRPITAILNDAIEHTTAVWSDDPVTIDDRIRWMAERMALGYPILVADDGAVVGFATFGDFRPWPGYRNTVELSIYVKADQRGRGIGRAMLFELVTRARGLGKKVMEILVATTAIDKLGKQGESPASTHQMDRKLWSAPIVSHGAYFRESREGGYVRLAKLRGRYRGSGALTTTVTAGPAF
jgi:L-amino acid N-acyltransferase YncA